MPTVTDRLSFEDETHSQGMQGVLSIWVEWFRYPNQNRLQPSKILLRSTCRLKYNTILSIEIF